MGEPAQADYETLRAAVLAGVPLSSAEAARFERGGLWALIRRPSSPTVFTASVLGASRRPWSAHADPRLDALAASYELLVSATPDRGSADEPGLLAAR
ncbi:MAG: hypothetical protein ACRDKD_09310 [Solirubrobacteraceae bacterium]